MSHRSFPNSQQFFTHRTYFLACLVDRGFDLSHLSSVNQLWLTAWPCLPMGGPDSLTALWQSTQWKLLCIILYIIVHTFLTIKGSKEHYNHCSEIWQALIMPCGMKGIFLPDGSPVFHWHNTLSIHYRSLWARPDRGTLLGSGLACPWHPISGDHLSDDIFSFWKGKLGFFPQQEGHW